MNKFRTYIRDSGQTLGSFADRVGISGSYMSEIASGKKPPGVLLARDISVATGRYISTEWWADLHDLINGVKSKTKEKPK